MHFSSRKWVNVWSNNTSKKKRSQKLEIMSFIQQIVLFSIVHFLDNVEMISACCHSKKKKIMRIRGLQFS